MNIRNMDHLQIRTVEIGRDVFGSAAVDDTRERALRFGEEAIELLHSAGLSFADIVSLAHEEFVQRQKPAGELSQEIAGTQTTLFALASVHKINVYDATVKELVRVLNKKDECRAKHDAKPAHLVAKRVA